MKYKIDTTTWKRREHYEFFNGMDDPFWGTVVPVDFTECYLEAKKRRTSFFLCSLHRIIAKFICTDCKIQMCIFS